jgi:hypothetical protein
MKITVKQLRTIIKEVVEMSQIDSLVNDLNPPRGSDSAPAVGEEVEINRLVDELNHVDWTYEDASGSNYYEGLAQVKRARLMLKETSPEILQSLRDYYSDPGNRGPSMGSNKDVLRQINYVINLKMR